MTAFNIGVIRHGFMKKEGDVWYFNTRKKAEEYITELNAFYEKHGMPLRAVLIC